MKALGRREPQQEGLGFFVFVSVVRELGRTRLRTAWSQEC